MSKPLPAGMPRDHLETSPSGRVSLPRAMDSSTTTTVTMSDTERERERRERKGGGRDGVGGSGGGGVEGEVGGELHGEEQRRPRNKLWSAVKTSLQAAHALRATSAAGEPRRRARQDDADEGRIDDEGLSTAQDGLWASSSSLPGRGGPTERRTTSKARVVSTTHIDQWQNIAHLFDEDNDGDKDDNDDDVRQGKHLEQRPGSSKRKSLPDMRKKKRQHQTPVPTTSDDVEEGAAADVEHQEGGEGESRIGSTARRKTKWKRFGLPPRTDTFETTTNNRDSINQEPESWIDSNPDTIPRREDPLAYAENQDRLLETDTDTDADSSDGDNDDGSEDAKTRIQSKGRWATLQEQIQPLTDPSPLTRTIIKCVVAYFVASLFTFSPFLSSRMAMLMPNQDPESPKIVPISNLHMIATVAVYFHPGRSIGSMIEANVFALVSFSYAILLGLTSMLTAVFLHDRDFPGLSNAITVVAFVGLGVTLVGYAKVKVAKPSFNTACSLISVIIFTVIVKEGSQHLGHYSTDKIWQSTLVVVAGVVVANIVCFALWPMSATTSLQGDIQRNLRSFATLLKVLTKTFLLDDVAEFNIKSDRIKRACDDHHSSFVSLKKNLAEAKLEAPFDRRMRGKVANYVLVVDSLNRLAQHLGGLRSSCSLQHEIIVAQRMKRRSEPRTQEGKAISIGDETKPDVDKGAFESFLGNVGPHMRSLVFTCSRTLRSLRCAFVVGRPLDSSPDGPFDGLAEDVSTALKRFQHEQTIAIKRLYTVFRRPDESLTLHPNLGLKSDEEVFLIFYFVFLLEEFSKELELLVHALDSIREDEVRIEEWSKLWWWQRLLRRFSQREKRRSKRKEAKFGKDHSYLSTISGLFRSSEATLPSIAPHQLNTAQTPPAVTARQRLNRFIWHVGQILKEPDTKFAIKAGLGCALLAAPAFIKSTRHIFTNYKGEWALISFMVVLSPTVGQSNQMSIHRIVGTWVGALAAVGAYKVFPDNNIALPIFGAFFSVPCFRWIIGRPQFATSGRFVLLTYNLSCLYSYNLRKTEIEVEEIAFHRTVAVIIGVVWATILNHLVWPFEARRELAKGLSDLLFNLAFLYQRLVLSYSSPNPNEVTTDFKEDGPASVERRYATSMGASGSTSIGADDVEEDIEEQGKPLLMNEGTRRSEKDEIHVLELSLQLQLIKLEGLLAQTKHEPRLKGPFPVATYRKFISSCQAILDLLHTMHQVTSRSDWHDRVRKDFVVPVDEGGKRREMVGNVGLFFWLLASAFHLKMPLPPYLPPAEQARLQVLEAIRQLPVVKKRAIRGSSEYLLYFAYALSMKDLIFQLEAMGKLAQETFGVLGGSVENFERQFHQQHPAQGPDEQN